MREIPPRWARIAAAGVALLTIGAAGTFAANGNPQTASSGLPAPAGNEFKHNRARAVALLKQKQFAAAIPFLEKARTLNSADYENGLDLATAYADTRQWEKARTQAESLLAIRNTPELHEILAQVAAGTDDRKKEAAEYQIAAQMDPSEMRIFNFGESLLVFDSDAAITIFSYGVKKFPNSERLRVGLGIAYYFHSSYDQAADTLCQAVDLNPGDSRPIEFLGKIEVLSPERFREVNQRLGAFLGSHPNDADANYFLARNLLHPPGQEPSTDGVAKAERLLKIAVRLNPKMADAYFELGQVREGRGQKAGAMEAYRRAATIDPRQSRFHYRLGLLYREAGETGKASQELAEFKRLQAAEAAAEKREVQRNDGETPY